MTKSTAPCGSIFKCLNKALKKRNALITATRALLCGGEPDPQAPIMNLFHVFRRPHNLWV